MIMPIVTFGLLLLSIVFFMFARKADMKDGGLELLGEIYLFMSLSIMSGIGFIISGFVWALIT